MRGARLGFLLCGLVLGGAHVWAAPAARELDVFYQPLRVAEASLAPDGKHVAFLVREHGALEVQVFSVASPYAKTRVPLDSRRDAQPHLLAWIDATRLIAASNTPSLIAVDANGGRRVPLADPQLFALKDKEVRTMLRVRGLRAGDPTGVTLEVARTTSEGTALELWRLDAVTGERKREHELTTTTPNDSLIVDRQGRPRVLLARENERQPFLYRPVAGTGAWRPLDRVLGLKPAFGFEITPQNYLGERSIPLGFADDPEVLYFASNLGRDTFGLYALDLRTQRRTDFVVEDPHRDLVTLEAPWVDPPLIFDRARRTPAGVRLGHANAPIRWLEPEFARIEAAVAEKFSARDVRLCNWDDARERFLVGVASPGDAGRYFVYHRADGRCVEFLRRAAADARQTGARVERFSVELAGGARVHGTLAFPSATSVAKPPLVLWLGDGPWRPSVDLTRDLQALAAMGFMVAQIEYRGTDGDGRAGRAALRASPDAGPVDDLRAVLAWLEPRQAFDRRRIAAVGEGLGGYVVLRTLQLAPTALRCAVALNAPVDPFDYTRSLAREQRVRQAVEQEQIAWMLSPPMTPEERESAMERRSARMMSLTYAPLDFEHELLQWQFGASGAGRGESVLRHADKISVPLLLLHEVAHRRAPHASVAELRAALERRNQPVALAPLPPQFARGVASARAQTLRRIGEFLNVTLYDFDVKIGEAKEKK